MRICLHIFCILQVFLCFSQQGDYYLVTANNGLNVRNDHYLSAQKTGKIPFETLVKKIEETNIELVINDDNQLIRGTWVKVAYNDNSSSHETQQFNTKGYVFDAYLKTVTLQNNIINNAIPEAKATEISLEKFKNTITNEKRKELDIISPSKIYEYSNSGKKYYALFTTLFVSTYKTKTVKKKLNFYILKQHDSNSIEKYSIQNRISENKFTNINETYTEYNYLMPYCSFKDHDKDGKTDPIIVTQSSNTSKKTTHIYILQDEKTIPITIYSNIKSINELLISPYFYTLSEPIKNHVINTIKKLDIINFKNIDDVWNNNICFWNNHKTIQPYKSNTYIAPISLSKPLNNLSELKNAYELAFPISENIKIDFPVSKDLNKHTGTIYNNTNEDILLPYYTLEYVYVSEKNDVYKQQIHLNKSLVLKAKEQKLIDDTEISYNLYDKEYFIQYGNYYDGWDSKNMRLFPENMPKGNYVAYATLSYFDGVKEQKLYSKKETIHYFSPENLAKKPAFLALKNKYEELYPTSTDLVVDNGICVFRKNNAGISDYFYSPHIKNASYYEIDVTKATIIFYFIDKKGKTYTRKEKNAFFRSLAPNDEDILADSNKIHIIDDFWTSNNRLTNEIFPKNMPKGYYLMYSELISPNGESYYSSKELIENLGPLFNTTNTAPFPSLDEFYKEIAPLIPKDEEYPDYVTNCYEETINNETIKTCYYPKQLKFKHLYRIIRSSYRFKNNMLIDSTPKIVNDTLRIDVGSIYKIYKDKGLNVIKVRY